MWPKSSSDIKNQLKSTILRSYSSSSECGECQQSALLKNNEVIQFLVKLLPVRFTSGARKSVSVRGHKSVSFGTPLLDAVYQEI